MVAQVLIVIIFDDGRKLLECIPKVYTEEDEALFSDGTLTRHEAFTLPWTKQGGSFFASRFSSMVNPIVTLGFVGRQSTLFDGFLFMDELAEPVPLGGKLLSYFFAQ